MCRTRGKRGRIRVAVVAMVLGGAGPEGGRDAGQSRPEVPKVAPVGAGSCTGCHSKGAGIGLLQGRPAEDTLRIMEGYRSGERPATVMNRIVKGLSVGEVYQMSLWFSVQ